MLTWERIRQLRALIVRAAQSLADDDAYFCPEFFEKWQADTQYWDGKDGTHEVSRVQDEGVLYRCFQSHKSQSDWAPHITPALWERIPDPAEEWPEWIPPIGSTGLYAFGARCSHIGKHWISDYDNNGYEPGVFGWHEHTGDET